MTDSVAIILLSSTLSALVCIRPTKNLLWQAGYRYYSEKSLPQRVHYFALAILQLLLALIIGLLLIASTFLDDKLRLAAFVTISICAAIPCGLGLLTIYYRSIVELLARPADHWRASRTRRTILAVISIGVVTAITFSHWIIPAIRALLTAGGPIALIVWLKLCIAGLKQTHELESKPCLSYVSRQTNSARVVWILFDEWDYRLSFCARPEGVNLPHFDEFRKSSVFCLNAYPPCRCTEISVPALFNGRLIDESWPLGPSELRLLMQDDKSHGLWTEQRTIFQEIRALGVNAALLGWYHPFSRLLGDQVVRCMWYAGNTQESSLGEGYLTTTCNLARSLLETPRLSPFGPSLVARAAVNRFHDSLRDAITLLLDDQLGFVLLHFAIPHAPFIFDRRTRTFGIKNPSPSDYFGNLELADFALGQIVEIMRNHGRWDESTVILSSDHSWRMASAFDGRYDARVPFAIKMPNQNGGAEYMPAINTVCTHRLVLDVFQGLDSSPSLLSWLRSHGVPAEPTKA